MRNIYRKLFIVVVAVSTEFVCLFVSVYFAAVVAVALPNYVFECLLSQIPFNSNLRHITIYMYVMYKHFSIIV